MGFALIFLARLAAGCRRRARTAPPIKPHPHGVRKRIIMNTEDEQGDPDSTPALEELKEGASVALSRLPTVLEDGAMCRIVQPSRPIVQPNRPRSARVKERAIARHDVSLAGRTAAGARARPQSAAVLRGRPDLGMASSTKKDMACQAAFPPGERSYCEWKSGRFTSDSGPVQRPTTAPPRERRSLAPGLPVDPHAAMASSPSAENAVGQLHPAETSVEAASCAGLWEASIDSPRIPRHTSRPISASRPRSNAHAASEHSGISHSSDRPIFVG